MSLHPWNVKIMFISTFQLVRLNLHLFIRDVSSSSYDFMHNDTVVFFFFCRCCNGVTHAQLTKSPPFIEAQPPKIKWPLICFFLKQRDDLCSACVSSPLSTGGAVRGRAVTSSLFPGVRGQTLWIEIYQSMQTWGRNSDGLALTNRFQCLILVMASATGRLGDSLGVGDLF